jgi:hypothetical protein
LTAKIFGIGLSRTGTKSLCEALGFLGYRTAHYTEHKSELRGLNTWFAGDFDTDSLVAHDAAVDLPIPIFYPELDERYPGSKFVLTVRDVDSWIASVRRHWAEWQITDDPVGRYRQMLRLAMYGIHGFATSRMRHVYQTHVRNVRWYFRGRPDDLLVLDVCAAEGWETLCPFLSKRKPSCLFPWLNKG